MHAHRGVMGNEIKGYVPPPEPMPDHLTKGRRADRAIAKRAGVEVPLLARLFAWFLAVRAVAYLAFALIVGGAPESDAAVFVAQHFNHWPPPATPEAVFYALAILNGILAWRWLMRDWKARWAAMFLSGTIAVRAIIDLAAAKAAGADLGLTPSQQGALGFGIALNLIICAYLAFYPGMAQAFRETPWE